jgi:hypothetical protein
MHSIRLEPCWDARCSPTAAHCPIYSASLQQTNFSDGLCSSYPVVELSLTSSRKDGTHVGAGSLTGSHLVLLAPVATYMAGLPALSWPERHHYYPHGWS